MRQAGKSRDLPNTLSCLKYCLIALVVCKVGHTALIILEADNWLDSRLLTVKADRR